MTTFDISRIIFSRYGSHMGISDLTPDNPTTKHLRTAEITGGLWLCAFQGESGRELVRLEVLDGAQVVPYTTEANPAVLTLSSAGKKGTVRIAFSKQDEIRISGQGYGLRLTLKPSPFDVVDIIDEHRCRIVYPHAFRILRLTTREGFVRGVSGSGPKGPHLSVDLTPDESGRFDACFQRCKGQMALPIDWQDFDVIVEAVAAEFDAFAAPLIKDVPEGYREAARLAAYVNWATVVAADGLFKRDAMLMSKNYMCCIWSWDHAFNALAHAQAQPRLAWDQMLIPFDHQLPSGELPDFMNSILTNYNFTKPPVHGWLAGWMLRYGAPPGGMDTLLDVYERFAKWGHFWLNKVEGDCPIPVQHHGCDGGWDNATVNDGGLPVYTTENTAYLILHYHFLSELATQLGRPVDAAAWKNHAETLARAFVDRLWRDGRFVAERLRDGGYEKEARSLITIMPILAAEYFPPEVKQALLQQLRDMLTPWGLATEHPDSPRYQPEGYWRGPIWAPSTLIAADGARRAGDPELAHDIARRFCNLCHHSGFAENFNALTGEPLCDQAYTWTSSVFLVLAREFLQPGDGPTDCQKRRNREGKKT